MPSILNLKFKGNKSFVAFSNLNDTESLTKTWKVCTKVASYLEQGQRLENLSWRLWHLQNLMVDTDNARSKREFKKLSKCMGDKLDKERGRSIEELEAPDFKRNHSTEMIRQRAVEKERSREASQNAQPGTIKRMQFTFSVDQPQQQTFSSAPVKKPDTKPSAEFNKRGKARSQQTEQAKNDAKDAPAASITSTFTITTDTTTTTNGISNTTTTTAPASLHFPGLFNNDFGPNALLYAAPTVTNRMNYGEGFNPSGNNNDSFSISRPTIELALDEILFSGDEGNSENTSHHDWNSGMVDSSSSDTQALENQSSENYENVDTTASSAEQQQDVVMSSLTTPAMETQSGMNYVPTQVFTVPSSNSSGSTSSAAADDEGNTTMSDEEDLDSLSPAPSTAKKTSNFKNVPPLSQTVKETLPETVAPSRVTSIYGTRSSTPTGRPTLTLRTNSVATRSSGPSATATSLNPALLRATTTNLGNSAPGGVKAECSNCGATHTPLWRRGLNDELNCNACGLYCKLHKRPRPKSMRNSHGESRTQVAPRQETVDVMGKYQQSTKVDFTVFTEDKVRQSVAAQCYNCHTTATPLWRKDDEGKTVCNACGLYYKLHGSARPISMKSDVIRKRSRHDAARRGTSVPEDTPSASPGVSRRTSPVPEASPTLAPDSTTQMSYEFNEEPEFRHTTSSSELMGALGNNNNETTQTSSLFNAFPLGSFPGPYHPDYLLQMYPALAGDALPFSETSEPDLSPRSNKRRRMSTDSGSEPPSSAVSFGSYSGDSFSSTSSTGSHSKRASMEFPFSTYNSNGTINQGPALRGSGNTFWHPPMMPQASDNETTLFQNASSNGNNNNNNNGNGNSSNSASSSSSNSVDNEDSPMDYLHPPMTLQDEESLFSAYLHPPMTIPEDGNKGQDSLMAQAGMYVDNNYYQ